MARKHKTYIIQGLMSIMILFLSGMGIYAQNTSFSATISKNPVAVNENFQYSLTLRNLSGTIMAPDFGDLQVLSGPNPSKTVRIVNGQRNSEYSETWILRAPKKGNYKIGTGFVVVNGKKTASNPVNIQVSDSPANSGLQSNANMLVDIELSQRSAFVGEQIVAVYKLYSKLPDLRFEAIEYPPMNGFWTETMEESMLQWQNQYANINGAQYRVAVLKTEILYPQHAGTLSIEPVKIEAMGKRSFFDRYQKLIAESKVVNIEVKPLPANPTGKNIGTFEQLGIQVELDRNVLPANEAATLKVKLNGKGNLKLVDAPEFDFPADLEVFDPKREDKINVNGSGMNGSRTFEYVMIPRSKGEYVIPSTTLSFFDPNSKSYKQLVTPELKLNVSKGSGVSNSSYTYNSKTDVSILNTDIRFIQTDSSTITAIENRFFGSAMYYGLSLLPFLAFGLVLFKKRQEEDIKSNPADYQKKRAAKVAQKQLATAKKLEGSGNSKAFYGELIRAMHDYLSNKFGIETSELSERIIKEKLKDKISDSSLTGLAEFLKDCEMARFAGLGIENESGMIGKAEKLIHDIEREAK
jgi:hypothetical protein